MHRMPSEWLFPSFPWRYERRNNSVPLTVAAYSECNGQRWEYIRVIMGKDGLGLREQRERESQNDVGQEKRIQRRCEGGWAPTNVSVPCSVECNYIVQTIDIHTRLLLQFSVLFRVCQSWLLSFSSSISGCLWRLSTSNNSVSPGWKRCSSLPLITLVTLMLR